MTFLYLAATVGRKISDSDSKVWKSRGAKCRRNNFFFEEIAFEVRRKEGANHGWISLQTRGTSTVHSVHTYSATSAKMFLDPTESRRIVIHAFRHLTLYVKNTRMDVPVDHLLGTVHLQLLLNCCKIYLGCANTT